jgi:Putative sensor
MNNGISAYLAQLKNELSGSDPATAQDALSDAEEYLRSGVSQILKDTPELSEDAALQRVVEEYGTPAEVAGAYREIETRVRPTLAPVRQDSGRSGGGFFGVFADPRAYAAMLYMIFALATGIFYFTWVTTGLSLSLGLIVLIIGLPFFGLFLLSVRGIALVEGRIVEALLGVRMPRRPMFTKKNPRLWEGFKALFLDSRSWFAMIYMVLQLPLGILYFTLVVTMLALGLGGIATPILQYVFGLPVAQFGHSEYYAPVWLVALIVIVGFAWLIVTMHVAKIIGTLHGKFAKAMLVRE